MLGGRYMQTNWNSAQVEILFRVETVLGYMNTLSRAENKIFQPGLKSKSPFAVCLYVTIYKWLTLLNKSSEIPKMKRQKKMEKTVLALISALTTCLLLLQCYSILALKIMRVRSQLSILRWKQYCRETTPLLDSKW